MGRLSLRERLIAKRAAETGEPAEQLDGHWYVLHTYSGYENKVQRSIEHRIDAQKAPVVALGYNGTWPGP